MKSWTCALLVAIFSSTLFAAEPGTTINVDFAHPGIKVSPTLYGVFFEEINRSGDGGIYAEMLDNRSFEDSEKIVAWNVKKGDGVEATATLDTTQPIHEWNPKSLHVELTKPGEGGIAIVNEGFKGLAV